MEILLEGRCALVFRSRLKGIRPSYCSLKNAFTIVSRLDRWLNAVCIFIQKKFSERKQTKIVVMKTKLKLRKNFNL